jgi:hypothetical protein
VAFFFLCPWPAVACGLMRASVFSIKFAQANLEGKSLYTVRDAIAISLTGTPENGAIGTGGTGA